MDASACGILRLVSWEGASRAIRTERWCPCCARWQQPSVADPGMDGATPRAHVAVGLSVVQPHMEAATAAGPRLRVLSAGYSSTTSAGPVGAPATGSR